MRLPSSDAAAPIIKRFEGLHKQVIIKLRLMVAPYRCPAGIPTIGYGHVCRPDQRPITEAEADAFLTNDMRLAGGTVLRAVQVPLADPQFSALVSFTFNVGSGAFRASTLRRKVNEGDMQGAADEFEKWKFAGGRALPGLLARRLVEKQLFLS